MFFGDWESGPWLGWRSRERPAASYGWAGLGWAGTPHHGAWRHVCLTLDFHTGATAAYEAGLKYFDGQLDDLKARVASSA